MSTTHTAELIASAMNANCDAHLRGEKPRQEWSEEQKRLWKLAADRAVASQVLKLVTGR